MEIKKKYQENIVKFSNKKIKCPNCKKKSAELYTPFCSKKCGDLDLLKWLSDQSYINMDR